MTGHRQVAVFRSQETKGQNAMSELMRGVAKRFKPGCGPEIYTADMHFSEQDFLSETFPTALEGGSHSQPTKGVLSLSSCEVHYIRSDSDLTAAESILFRSLAARVGAAGLDLERGSDQVPAVFQLPFDLPGSKTQIVVLHLFAIVRSHISNGRANRLFHARIGASLKALADQETCFVGSQVSGDFTRPRTHFNFSNVPFCQQRNLHSTWELHKRGSHTTAAKRKAKSLIFDYKLPSFWEVLLVKRLPKGSVRRSEWNSNVLSTEQISYAALDGLAYPRCHTAIVGISKLDIGGEIVCSPDTHSSSEEECGCDNLQRTFIKGDIKHFHDRAKRQLNEGMDPVSQLFSTRLAECFLQTNEKDIAAVMEHLVKNRGLSEANARKVLRTYFKRFVRMQTRESGEMKKMMNGMFELFRDAKTTRGNSVFKPGMRDEIDALQGRIDDS